MTESPDEHGDQPLRRLVQLTRDTLADAGEEGDVDELGFARLREARAAAGQRSPGRRLGWALALAGVGFVAVGAAAGWRFTHRPSPLTFEIVGAPEPSGETRADDGTTRIVFSEGSELALGDGARAAVRELAPNGARVVLAHGRSRAFFAPAPSARWRIDAGPYAVEVAGEVTGTAFDVDWSEEGQSLELWLRAGSARVTGPLIGNGMALTRGQHLSTHVRDNKIVLDTHPRAPER